MAQAFQIHVDHQVVTDYTVIQCQ